MKIPTPSFASTLLQRVWDIFAKRRKALKYRGEFRVEVSDPNDDSEWIRFVHSSGSRPVLIVELTEHGILHVYVRSNARVSRGRVLLRLEFLRPFDNPARLLSAFEASLDVLDSLATEEAEEVRHLLQTPWEDLTPRLVDPE